MDWNLYSLDNICMSLNFLNYHRFSIPFALLHSFMWIRWWWQIYFPPCEKERFRALLNAPVSLPSLVELWSLTCVSTIFLFYGRLRRDRLWWNNKPQASFLLTSMPSHSLGGGEIAFCHLFQILWKAQTLINGSEKTRGNCSWHHPVDWMQK